MGKTVALMYGFTEGQWHGRLFRKELSRRGYKLVADPHQADIVIAHSGGCYYVPLDLHPDQLVVLIDPTYWPHKSLATRARTMTLRLIRAIRPGNRPLYHLQKTTHNLGYLLRHGDKNQAMIRRAHKYNLEAEISHTRIILVRNHDDPWLTPDLKHLKKINPRLKLVELPGEHDDLWLHPDSYIDLIQS